MKTIYDFTLKDMRGKDVSLSDYQGKVPIAWTRIFRKNKKSINSVLIIWNTIHLSGDNCLIKKEILYPYVPDSLFVPPGFYIVSDNDDLPE